MIQFTKRQREKIFLSNKIRSSGFQYERGGFKRKDNRHLITTNTINSWQKFFKNIYKK